MGKLYEIFGDNAHEMTVKLLEASQAADRIPKDGTVLLKPNLVLASPPEQGATTHPRRTVGLYRIPASSRNPGHLRGGKLVGRGADGTVRESRGI